MPEKGRNETPLHLAVKFGSVEVVEVLTSYAQCSYTINSDGKYPKDIICFRCPPDTINKDVINQIAELLEERFYVPVIRCVDNSMPPIIGEPFSPTNPPNFVFDALSPEMQIQACAGPMTKEKAETFRKRRKTPPRLGRQISPSRSPVASTPERNTSLIFPRKLFSFTEPTAKVATDNNNSVATESSIESLQNVRSNDNDLTRTIDGNSNNVTNGNSYSHYNFDLYNMYRNKPLIDLNISTASSDASDRGFDSPMYAERHVQFSDTKKGLEMIGREIAKDQNIKWQEYWSFLGDFADIGSLDGLNKLENHLRKSHDRNATNKTAKNPCSTPISSLWSRLNNLEVNVVDREWDKSRTKSFIKSVKKMDLPFLPPTVPASFGSPYSCVEKSCQVYSKRLAVSILYNLDSVISVNDVLKSEIKRLNSLISSYKDDARFHFVNFQATHSRFAGWIVHYLMLNNCDKSKFKNSLTQILASTRKIIAETNLFRKEPQFMNMQQICVINHLLRVLDSDDDLNGHLIPPEVMSTEQDYSELWQSECKCDCEWSNEKSRQQRRCRPKFAGNFSFSLNGNGSQSNENSNKLENLHPWRSSPDDSDDDDDFFSDAENRDDENEIFYTSPSSPSQLIDDDDEGISDQSIVPNSYSMYLLCDEPTKTDMHVLSALKNVEIDKLLHPYTHQWKSALLQHTQEEIENFPSPCVIVKGRQASNLSVRELFRSPMKFQLSPVKKTVRFSNFFKPSKSPSFSGSDYSPDSDASPLSRMMVSPFEPCTSASSTDSAKY